MKNKFLINSIVLISLFFASCSTDDSNEDNTNMNESETPIGEISSIDKQLISQIKKAGDAFNTDQIWSGFNLSTMPLYLIHKNKEGKADRGIIINPQSTIPNATEINEDSNQGLKVYRYDEEIEKAFQVINSDDGNGLYDFDFNINGNNYYIQVYNDAEVIAGEELATYPGGFFDPNTITIGSIDFIMHENFHTFQDIALKTLSKGNAENKKPISKEVFELRTLMHQIFKNFPNGNLDKTTLEEKLKQYVAIRSKQIELDSGISSGYNATETQEGSARYIEKMALRTLFSKRASEPFIEGTVLENDYGITNKEILNQVFDFALSYEIGASACYAISTINREALDDINTNKSIYLVAKDLFNMNNIELEKQLENAKNSVDWNAIQVKVAAWDTLN